MVTVRAARIPGDLDPIRGLLREYFASVDVAACFEDFGAELAGLPGEYAPPRGGLLVAVGGDDLPAGCVALRSLDADTAEMKRLYLGPAARAHGAGRLLVVTVLDLARSLGYRAIRLDTLPTQSVAQRIYESVGFVDVVPYRRNPVVGTRYLELQLRS